MGENQDASFGSGGLSWPVALQFKWMNAKLDGKSWSAG